MGDEILRVMVVDDQPIVRWGLRQLISSRSTWRLCAEAGDGDAAVDLALNERPHIAVLSNSVGYQKGLEVLRRMREHSPETRVLMYTGHSDAAAIADAMRAGVRGHVLKSDSMAEVEGAIEAIANGGRYFSMAVTAILDNGPDEPVATDQTLTARELEVATLIADGLSNRQIALALNRSIKTIESHRISIMRKADVHSTAALVRYVITNRLAAP